MTTTTRKTTTRKTTTTAKGCACGCGHPVPPRSTFQAGHDARLASRVASEAVIAIQAGKAKVSTPSLYSELPSAALKAKARTMTENRLAREAKAAKATKAAAEAKAS